MTIFFQPPPRDLEIKHAYLGNPLLMVFFWKKTSTKWDDCPLPCSITGGHRKYGLTLAPRVRPEVVSAGEATAFQKSWTAFELRCHFEDYQRCVSNLFVSHGFTVFQYCIMCIILRIYNTRLFISLNNSKNFLIRSCLNGCRVAFRDPPFIIRHVWPGIAWSMSEEKPDVPSCFRARLDHGHTTSSRRAPQELTATSLEWWIIKGIIFKFDWPYFRMVYC